MLKKHLRLAVCLSFVLGSSLCSVTSQPLYAHSTVITSCVNGVEKVKKLKEQNLPNGLIAEIYDVQGNGRTLDGTPDIVSYSAPVAGEHRPFPLFYEVDEDGDGVPDKLYIDKLGTGSCEGVDLYDDYNKAGSSPHRSPSEMPRFLTEN